MNHKFSIEKLYHFNCGKCKRWWSIGDFDINTKTLICPYVDCKHEARLEYINEEIENEIDSVYSEIIHDNIDEIINY